MAVPTPPPPRPPTTILLAAWLFAGTSAFWLSAAIATLFAVPDYAWHFAAAGGSEKAGTSVVQLVLIAVVFAVPVAAASALLGAFGARGGTGVRALTWFVGCTALGLSAILLPLSPYPASWHRWVMNLVAIVTVLLVAATLTLLTLRPSRAFFHATRDARLAATRAAWAARMARQPVQWYPPRRS